MKKLYRSKSKKFIAGICGGIGEIYNVDPTLLRLACVFVALITGIIPVLITYIIAWIVIPLEDEDQIA